MATIDGTHRNDRLIGSASADRINGLAGNDVLEGRGGDDRLIGGDGADLMRGGTGNDTYWVNDPGDTVEEALSGGSADVVKSAITYRLGVHVEHLTLIGTADISGSGNERSNRITGNEGDNKLSGGQGNDVLDGGRGTDILRGGTGNDQYFIDRADDQVIDAGAGGGLDTLYTAANYTLPGDIENAIVRGSLKADVVGNALANEMKGNSANNSLQGLAGDDLLVGNSGNDSLVGGQGSDTIFGGAGNDYLVSSATYLDDDMTKDVMRGGLGNDYYEIGAGDDFLESAGGGIDTIRTRGSMALPDHFENLDLLGNDAASVLGNGENNVINGNAGDNEISGRGGNDTIVGNDGIDLIRGGSGNDRLTGETVYGDAGFDILFGHTMFGGTGPDTFRTAGDATIQDFVSADDRIDLSADLFLRFDEETGEHEGRALQRGPVPEWAFAIGTAKDANDYVIYDPETGKLFVDTDGNGKEAEAVEVAILIGSPSLTAADLFVVGSGTWGTI